jgi:lipoprotein-anchoring transpeptidase ErfK/SrfK
MRQSFQSCSVSRRAFLATTLTAPLGAKLTGALTQNEPVDPATLKPGEFNWSPERSSEGPVVVLVSLPKQWVVIYRNGVQIGSATCSTGRPGHRTPAGVFVILEKDKAHHSSKYDNAPMPYMERLTWNGVALHAANLPGCFTPRRLAAPRTAFIEVGQRPLLLDEQPSRLPEAVRWCRDVETLPP